MRGAADATRSVRDGTAVTGCGRVRRAASLAAEKNMGVQSRARTGAFLEPDNLATAHKRAVATACNDA